jgi:hypothetical protein
LRVLLRYKFNGDGGSTIDIAAEYNDKLKAACNHISKMKAGRIIATMDANGPQRLGLLILV